MPEGPEVKSITDQLILIKGYRINDVQIYKEHKDKYKQLNDTIGKIITNVFCFGKKIAFQLDEGYILTSLIMTGKWLITNKGNAIIKMSFVKNEETCHKDDVEKVDLYYHDDRRLGDVSYYSDDNFKMIFNGIGLDFLNDNITCDEFYDIARKSQGMIVSNFLLDQSRVAGIGNYLRCDILYHAKINPFSKIRDLSDDDIDRLYNSCEYIINKSYENKGYSIGDGKNNYMLPFGQRGGYEPLVYKRTKDEHGNKVEKHKKKGGQTIYYVPL